MAFTGTTRGKKKRVIFRAVSLLAGLLPRVLFWDNNKDVISNDLATLKLMLPELEEAGFLFQGLDSQCTYPSAVRLQSNLSFKKSELNVERDGIGERNCLQNR